MFVLAELQDVVRVDPWRFGKDMNEVITDTLNNKLANKVMHNVGLCIALYDIIHVGDSYVFPSDGASHTKVRFRFVVFRPFIDELLVGTIRSSSPEGIRVSLGFFDDIHIPKQSLQYPSRFDQDEQSWVWEYETEEGKHDMFMDEGEQIRFRVVEETFVDVSPFPAQAVAADAASSGSAFSCPTAPSDKGSHESKEQQVPYTITGSISESGLGLLSWWTG